MTRNPPGETLPTGGSQPKHNPGPDRNEVGEDCVDNTRPKNAGHQERMESLVGMLRTLETLVTNLPGMTYRFRADVNDTAEFVSAVSDEALGKIPGFGGAG